VTEVSTNRRKEPEIFRPKKLEINHVNLDAVFFSRCSEFYQIWLPNFGQTQ